MSYRKPLIGLIIFLVISIALTWTVLVTLQRNVSGSTNTYSAVFTDVSGLRSGDDVRVAGVRVGRVDSVALDGTLAKVTFKVQDDQVLYGNTKASVTYQNIIGQRYIGLSLGDAGEAAVLPDGGEIPVEHTEPSFDIAILLNGFEPLFSVLDPRQVDNITSAVIKAMQGDTGSITTLIAQTSDLSEAFAGRDQILGDVITNLSGVVANLAKQSGSLATVITQTRDIFIGLSNRRDELVNSMDSISTVASRMSTTFGAVQPDLNQLLDREPGFVKHAIDNKDSFAYLGFNMPLALKGLARISQHGSYAEAYVCDVNTTLVPGLTPLIPAIVADATPGGVPEHSAICR